MNLATINKAGALMGIPPARLRKWLEEDRLPGFFSGTRFYVDMDALESQIRQGYPAQFAGVAVEADRQ